MSTNKKYNSLAVGALKPFAKEPRITKCLERSYLNCSDGTAGITLNLFPRIFGNGFSPKALLYATLIEGFIFNPIIGTYSIYVKIAKSLIRLFPFILNVDNDSLVNSYPTKL